MVLERILVDASLATMIIEALSGDVTGPSGSAATACSMSFTDCLASAKSGHRQLCFFKNCELHIPTTHFLSQTTINKY
jgi:hypothetical protein